MAPGDNRLDDPEEPQGFDGEFFGVRWFYERSMSTSADVLLTGKSMRTYEPVSEA